MLLVAELAEVFEAAQNVGSTVVAFVAREGASYITGTTIFADGGIMQGSPGL
jgi:hypothetical protein